MKRTVVPGWLPIHPNDYEKTAFCPGPGMGLLECHLGYQEHQVPQRLMDTVLRDLPFVSKYIDDILLHSASEEEHLCHLQLVFERLKRAGLTLRERKCHIGMSQAPYLGHTFSKLGMAPEKGKLKNG